MKKIKSYLCVLISVSLILSGCSSGSPSLEEAERNEGKTLVATFTQVGVYDHEYYSDLDPSTVPQITIFEDGTFDFLCNYDGGTAIFSGEWQYFSTDNPIYYVFRITDCVESNNVDPQYIDDVLTKAPYFENTFEIAYNTARCDADFGAICDAYFGLTSDDEVLFHVEMEPEFEVESTQNDFHIDEEPVIESGLDVNIGIIGYPMESILEDFKYNNVIVMDWSTNIYMQSDSPIFARELTGRENTYLVEDMGVAITELDGTVILWEQDVLDCGNVYQLMHTLGGEFSRLLDYKPEIIPTDYGHAYLRWETKQAYIIVLVSADNQDWKATSTRGLYILSKF